MEEKQRACHISLQFVVSLRSLLIPVLSLGTSEIITSVSPGGGGGAAGTRRDKCPMAVILMLSHYLIARGTEPNFSPRPFFPHSLNLRLVTHSHCSRALARPGVASVPSSSFFSSSLSFCTSALGSSHRMPCWLCQSTTISQDLTLQEETGNRGKGTTHSRHATETLLGSVPLVDQEPYAFLYLDK